MFNRESKGEEEVSPPNVGSHSSEARWGLTKKFRDLDVGNGSSYDFSELSLVI